MKLAEYAGGDMAKTILVVDDSANFRKPVEAALRSSGYEVTTASNGVEALSSIAQQPPHLVLLDLRMPIMDGLEALRVLREREPSQSLAVIVLSGANDREKIVRAAKLGISGYILKSGFSIKEMLRRIQAALDGGAATAPAVPTPSVKPDPVSAITPRSAAPDNGRATDSTTALMPLLTRAELLERVDAISELTAFSPSVSRLLNMTANQECSMTELADAVKQDPAIALKILRLANSSLYAHGDRLETVLEAVRRIGIQGIRQAVLNIGVVERFNAPAFNEHLSTPQFWEHSVACGIIASELARASGEKDIETAFTCGLLHDLGRIILAQALGDIYVRVLETAHTSGNPLEVVESRMLSLTHADIMDRVLNAWSFPKHLVDPIRFHHLPPDKVRKAAPTCSMDVLRLGLANQLAHALLLGNSGNETIYSTVDKCHMLGITREIIKGVEETARQRTDDARFALLSSSDTKAWTRHSEQVRQSLGTSFRPLFIGTTPGTDAFRIFCDQLSDPAGGAPNIAVLHVAATPQREALFNNLLAMEHSSGVRNLPLLVIAGQSGQAPNEDLLRGRKTRVLLTPIDIAQFLVAVRTMIDAGSSQAAA